MSSITTPPPFYPRDGSDYASWGGIDVVPRNIGSDYVPPRTDDRYPLAHRFGSSGILSPLPFDLPLELYLVPDACDPVDHEATIEIERVTETRQVQEQSYEEEPARELYAVREELEYAEGDKRRHRRFFTTFRTVVADEVNGGRGVDAIVLLLLLHVAVIHPPPPRRDYQPIAIGYRTSRAWI